MSAVPLKNAIALTSLALLCPLSVLADTPKQSSAPNTVKDQEEIKDQEQALSPIVVTGQWLGAPTEKSVQRHPGARNIVGEQALQKAGARNLEDALRQVPGVRVQDETALGILPNIGIRGLSPTRSEQVLILVDGIPITLAPYGQTGLSLFPVSLETVDRIDVARGGVATHYGPNNVGGVINIITKPIPAKTKRTIKQGFTIAKNGNVLSNTYARVGGYINDSFGLQAQAEVIRGDTFREHSDTQVENLMLDADWLIDANNTVTARLQYYNADTELPGALTPQAYEADRNQSQRPHDHFKGDTLRGHVIYNRIFANQSQLNWTTFAHKSHREFSFGRAGKAGVSPGLPAVDVANAPRDFIVYGTEPQYSFNVDSAVPQKILIGTRLMREEVDFVVNRFLLPSGPQSTLQDRRFENDAIALYASDTFSLMNGRLKVTPGVRYENIDLYFRNNQTGAEDTNDTEDFLPGLDIGYQVSDSLFAFANFHKSLRPVQFVHIVNNGEVLGSERAENYEIGFRLSPSENVSTTVTAFRIDFENKIEFDPVTRKFRNLGEAKHTGIETSVSWRPANISGLTLGGSYTYVDTEQLSGADIGKELPYAPHHQVALQSNYKTGDWNWNLNGSYNSSAFSNAANIPVENANGTAGPIPSYWLWNAQVTKDFRWDGTEMQAAFGINNLFDEEYYFRGVDYSPGRLPAPGRAVALSLKADF